MKEISIESVFTQKLSHRLKIIIADMSKYINALREKGRELFNSYLALKKHLEELKYTIDKLERENDQKKEVIAKGIRF